MKLGYRYARLAVILILSVLAFNLKNGVDGFSVYFGAGMLTTAFLTMIYVFINFDNELKGNLILEMIFEAFSGLIIFTYPESDTAFFIVTFSYWTAIMGGLLLVAGLFEPENKECLWFYTLAGLVFLISGFSIMHITAANQGLLNYYMSFVMLLYVLVSFRLLYKRKEDIY